MRLGAQWWHGSGGSLVANRRRGDVCAVVVAAIVAGVTGASPSAAAARPALDIPIACAVGTACVLQNYVDVMEGPEARDFTCHRLTYDGHGGTDFRVVHPADYAEGVPVVAAAPGTVRAIRNDMPDAEPGRSPTDHIEGREAGNAVVIRHGGRWETQYSHLRRGSVRVRPGERVERGTVLGTVGLSGRTEFPHLDFAVRRGDDTLDPFTGQPEGSGCDTPRDPLWRDAARERLAYQAGGVLRTGFLDRPPGDAALRGYVARRQAWSPDADALVFWIKVFGARPGDVLELELRGPDGDAIADGRHRFERHKANYLMFIGRRRGDRPRWPSGDYVGAWRWQRPGESGVHASGRARLRMDAETPEPSSSERADEAQP